MEDKNKSKTELSEIGEFGLIDRLTKGLKNKNTSTVFGVGDDATLLRYRDKDILVSTDLLLEGVHFNLTYTPLKHLGYKAAIVNFSDIYAMNGRPKQITVSLGISSKFMLEDIERIYEGIKLACKKYGVDIVGGDTSTSLTGLTISITVIGDPVGENAVFRNSAKENDLICITGNLGSAYLGLQVLERERVLFDKGKGSLPSLEGYEYIIGRQLKPEARKDIIESLWKKEVIPTSMIDISDGLTSELFHISKSSNCGCHIYSEKIPISEESARTAEELNMDPLTAALNGGEDYELLFTVKIHDHNKIIQLKDISIIGHIV
ncbi:MAG: thiamine-phosphate kinase, partial [Bacteroidota bacterium]|nr:thiamine-phosphate kinase [Bacteroidota bacterium]